MLSFMVVDLVREALAPYPFPTVKNCESGKQLIMQIILLHRNV